MPTPPDEAWSRERLGDALVDDFLAAAGNVGRSYLTGDEDLVFGFIQRVLLHMRNRDRSYGMIFPKIDQAYRRFFDYMDGAGHIYVIYPGPDDPAMLPISADWTVNRGEYFEIPEPMAREIVLAFLRTYGYLHTEHASVQGALREQGRDT